MRSNLRYFIQFFLDPAVPFSQKILPIAAILYLLFPFDLIPDPILGIGFLDDAALLIYVYMKMKRVLGEYKRGKAHPREARRRQGDHYEGVTIDQVEYKVRED